MQLFKHLSRSSMAAAFTRPSYLGVTRLQARSFAAGPIPEGNQTGLSDVNEIFKVNYTVEFE